MKRALRWLFHLAAALSLLLGITLATGAETSVPRAPTCCFIRFPGSLIGRIFISPQSVTIAYLAPWPTGSVWNCGVRVRLNDAAVGTPKAVFITPRQTGSWRDFEWVQGKLSLVEGNWLVGAAGQ